MSGSNRGDHSRAGLIGAAIVALGAIALYWSMFYNAGYQSGYSERKAEVEASHYASDTANQIDQKCSAKAGQAARECIAEIVDAERESQRSESDLAAQWKAADLVMWAGIIAGFQLLATGLGLYFVKRTLDATLDAVEDTSKATKAMERQNDMMAEINRPWLDFEIEVTGVPQFQFGEDDEAQLSIQVQITNHSDFPAHHVLVYGRGMVGSGLLAAVSMPELKEAVTEFLTAGSRENYGEVVFPKNPAKTVTTLTIRDPLGSLKETTQSGVTAYFGIRYTFKGGRGFTFRGFTLLGVGRFINFHENRPGARHANLVAPPITMIPNLTETVAT